MTRPASKSKTGPVDPAAAMVIAAEGELALLQERLAEARAALTGADSEERDASLTAARSGAQPDLDAYDIAIAKRSKADRIVITLADVLVPEAAAKVEVATASLALAERTACADAAEAACTEVAALMAEHYPQQIERLEALMARVEEADRQAATANSDLPAGRACVAMVEERIRDAAATPDRVVSEEPVDVWCYAGTTDPVPPIRIGDISSTNVDRISGRSVENRRMLRVKIAPAQGGRKGPRLKDMILPALQALRFTPSERIELQEANACQEGWAKAGAAGLSSEYGAPA